MPQAELPGRCQPHNASANDSNIKDAPRVVVAAEGPRGNDAGRGPAPGPGGPDPHGQRHVGLSGQPVARGSSSPASSSPFSASLHRFWRRPEQQRRRRKSRSGAWALRASRPFCLRSCRMLTEALTRQAGVLRKLPSCDARRHFWGWLNTVFNKVDHERIKDVGPDRAASEWLLRCGAFVRYHGFDRWQEDYNGLPTGPLQKYKIQGINATESCIMYKGFDYLNGLEHVEEIKFCKCMYIQDDCLQRLSETPSLQKSLLRLSIISCGNVTDKGIIALHKLSNLEYLFLRDLPGIKEKEATAQILRKSLPALELELDLE